MLSSQFDRSDTSVNPLLQRIKCSYWAYAACFFFFCAGRAFLPHLGIQNDEALFAAALFEPRDSYTIGFIHARLPIMIMSYLGTVKSWIYVPIFHIFGTGVSATRDPVLLAGVASVWLFYLLLRRTAGQRAALIGCGLLAADSLYLLTICFDWGPVALQHVLLIGGMLLLARFYQEGGSIALAGGCFLFGLAMWDKALAIWALSGIGIAGISVFPRQILGVITRRRVAISVLAFALGALPLIIYNVKHPLATFREGVSYDLREIQHKTRVLLATADSSGLFSWLVNDDWQVKSPHVPKGLIQKASAEVSALTGRPRHSLMAWAFCLALLLAPLARGHARRTVLFALIAILIGWVQMALTVHAGGSVHHTILLWPFPQMVVGVSLSAASRRLGHAGIPALAAVLAVLMLSGVLVTNEYFALAIRNGGGQNWTEAVFRLSDYMKGVSSENVICVDWGIFESLRLLNHGKLKLRLSLYPILQHPLSGEDRAFLEPIISDPGHIFIGHTKDFEFFEGANARLLTYASGAGFRREIMAVIPDNYGHQVYEIYHFAGTLGR